MIISLDIETVPNERAEGYFATTWVPPANIKDPEKIEVRRQAAIHGGGLNWWTGQVVCICATPVDAEGSVFRLATDNEESLLRSLFGWVNQFDKVTVTGKNYMSFDKPYMVGRALFHNIGIPAFLRNEDVRDVDYMFGYGRSAGQTGKLSDYAWGLGIEGKSHHGSEVWGMFKDKKLDEIEDYCMQDVLIVKEMMQRYLKEF